MDWSLCSNDTCGLGPKCYRRIATPSPTQASTRFAPYGERRQLRDTDDPHCLEVATVPAHCDFFKPLPTRPNETAKR